MQPNKKSCKGYGFVQFISILEAQRAIISLNARGINAAFAKQESFTARLRRLEDIDSTNIYLSNLPLEMDESSLSMLFYPANIQSLRVLKNSVGESRGVGFVRVKDRQTAAFFIDKLHGITLPGSTLPLQVRFADSQSQKDFKKVATRNRDANGDNDKSDNDNLDKLINSSNLWSTFKNPFEFDNNNNYDNQQEHVKHSKSFDNLSNQLNFTTNFNNLINNSRRISSFDPFNNDLIDLNFNKNLSKSSTRNSTTNTSTPTTTTTSTNNQIK